MSHIQNFSFMFLLMITLQTSYAENNMQLAQQLSSQIQSGEVIYHSVYTHKARPKIDVSSLQELVEYARTTPKQKVTYNSTIHSYFKGDKLRFDVDQPPTNFYPDPLLQTYIYDGSSLTMFNHIRVMQFPMYTSLYREGHIGTLYIPPIAMGYDINKVLRLAAKVKNQYGEIPSLEYLSVGNNTRVVGKYLNSDTSLPLVDIEWNEENPGVFNRCIYKQPHTPEYVEILPSEFSNINGVLYPKTTTVKQIFMKSLDDPSEQKVISEQILTVLEANFNDETIDDNLFMGDEFGNYKSSEVNREALRAQVGN